MWTSGYGILYKVHHHKAGQVIVITSQDTNKLILINVRNIVSVEDVGAYRVLTYMTTATSSYRVYAKESVEEIKEQYEKHSRVDSKKSE